jgi:hypothetical protein
VAEPYIANKLFFFFDSTWGAYQGAKFLPGLWLTGEEQVFTIADAVEEVSVQTSNFGVEFGRAGGGVFNVITKSGSNEPHG